MSTDADQTTKTETTNDNETARDTDTADSRTDRDQAFEETFEAASERMAVDPNTNESPGTRLRNITVSQFTASAALVLIATMWVYTNVTGIPHRNLDYLMLAVGFAAALKLFGENFLAAMDYLRGR